MVDLLHQTHRPHGAAAAAAVPMYQMHSGSASLRILHKLRDSSSLAGTQAGYQSKGYCLSTITTDIQTCPMYETQTLTTHGNKSRQGPSGEASS